MECYVKSSNHTTLDYLQNFKSLIWTERYSAFGDFKLMVSVDSPYRYSLVKGNHLHMVGSDYVMRIDSVEVKKGRDKNHIVASGRSLEALLERRTIMMDINKPPSTLGLIFAHVGSEFMGTSGGGTLFPPTKIVPGFSMDTTIPSGVTERPVWDYIFKNKTVYEAVKELADDHNIGFKLSLTTSNNLRFSIYNGRDKTGASGGNPAIFSFEMNNAKEMSYVTTDKNQSTVAILDFGDQGFAVPDTRVWLGATEPSGLDRRELRVDAAELGRRFDYGSSPILMENLLIAARFLGLIELRASQAITILDAEIENGKPPHYGHDYRLGDVVLMYNNVEVKTKYRVTEYIRSYDASGSSEYPTFEAIVE